MKTYKQRSHSRYQRHLRACLAVDGEYGLETTAQPLPNPLEVAGKQYTKVIDLDFMGCTATTLFDVKPKIAPKCHFDRLVDLASATEALNQKGVWVRVRILLLYPYSAAGQIRIQAENSRRRATMDTPSKDRDFKFIEQLSDEDFKLSSLFRTSRKTLRVIYDWKEALGESHPFLTEPNRFDLRFSIFNPIVCGLRLNGRFFFDVYSYAKRDLEEQICSGNTQPVIEVTGEDDLAYRSFCDHFRYLWNYDGTLDADDVVDLSRDFPRLFQPRNVTFREKVKRLSQQKGIKLSRAEERKYRVKASRVVAKHCPIVEPSSSREEAFVACAFRSRPDGSRRPNQDTLKLCELWKKYFVSGEVPDLPLIEINLLEGTVGQSLPELLYTQLRHSTLGIVVLSSEEKLLSDSEIAHCAPNVYHELGFLMATVPEDRTFVFREHKVSAPSNIGKLVQIDYEEGKLSVHFLELIRGVVVADVIGWPEAQAIGVSHIGYISRLSKQGYVSEDELLSVREYARERLGVES